MAITAAIERNIPTRFKSIRTGRLKAFARYMRYSAAEMSKKAVLAAKIFLLILSFWIILLFSSN
jgi:hypothetical protein